MKIWDLGSKVVNTVAPLGIVAGVVEYLYGNKFFTVLAVVTSSIILWLAWLEVRIRKVEGKRK